MRRSAILLLVAAAACQPVPPRHEYVAHMTTEELNAPPGSNAVKAKIISDVRRWRELHKRLAQGKPFCEGIFHLEGYVRCKKDETELEIYYFPGGPEDSQHRIQEKAYFCREEGVYYYHYLGGPRKVDSWLGPYKLDFKTIRPDESDQ